MSDSIGAQVKTTSASEMSLDGSFSRGISEIYDLRTQARSQGRAPALILNAEPEADMWFRLYGNTTGGDPLNRANRNLLAPAEGTAGLRVFVDDGETLRELLPPPEAALRELLDLD